jgi:lysophospholipase
VAVSEGLGVGSSKVRLHAVSWLPPQPREVALLSHGLAEHSGRYQELAGWLRSRGTALYAHDHRGHGRSGGARADIGSFQSVVDDLAARVRWAREQHVGLRLTLIGHSFGGAVALAVALEHPALADRLVLSAPAIGVDPELPRARILVGRVLAKLAPRAGMLTLDASAVSSDPAVVAAYRRDPLNFHGSIPARTLVELLDAMRSLAARAPRLSVATLVLHGTADRLVPLRFNAPVYERLGAADLTVRLYDGYFHELLNEPGRARVYADLGGWLDARR